MVVRRRTRSFDCLDSFCFNAAEQRQARAIQLDRMGSRSALNIQNGCTNRRAQRASQRNVLQRQKQVKGASSRVQSAMSVSTLTDFRWAYYSARDEPQCQCLSRQMLQSIVCYYREHERASLQLALGSNVITGETSLLKYMTVVDCVRADQTLMATYDCHAICRFEQSVSWAPELFKALQSRNGARYPENTSRYGCARHHNEADLLTPP